MVFPEIKSIDIRIGADFGKRIKALQLEFESKLGRNIKLEKFTDEILYPLMEEVNEVFKKAFKEFEKM